MKKIVAMFTLLAVLTACGGGGGGRPSEDDIAKALKDEDNAGRCRRSARPASMTTTIDCIAKAFHDSDLSDDALQAIVDGDEDFDGRARTTEDDRQDEDFQADFAKCITG